MLKNSCHLIKYVLENSHIKNWIKKIKIFPNPDGTSGFWRMTIEVKKSHQHLLSNIENMTYNLIACCESEYLSHEIKNEKLYLS